MSKWWSYSARSVRRRGGGLGLVAAVFIGGCVTNSERSLRVYAASSLAEVYGELARGFESENPGIQVELALAGSQVLRMQIEQGAGADVFASADLTHVHQLVEQRLMDAPKTFARNRLVVIVPKSNPAGIRAFADLPQATRLVLGTAQVPIGRYGREAIQQGNEAIAPGFEQQVLSRVVSLETNTRLIRAKVETGDADAALVYATDVGKNSRVLSWSLPNEVEVEPLYAMGRLAQSTRREWGARWMSYVLSPNGQQILTRHGFGGAP
jgi:molybdate transport system substrate-binding protein